MTLWEYLIDVAKKAPVGTLLAAIGTLTTAIVATVALFQKRTSDQRQAWWTRTQWAIDLALNDQDEQSRVVGLRAIEVIQSAKIPVKVDAVLLTGVASAVQDETALDTAKTIRENGARVDSETRRDKSSGRWPKWRKLLSRGRRPK